MITVRPYQKKDFRYVQDVCLATSWLGDDPTAENRAIVCSMYCDYYLDNEPEFCFVAVDENDIPVGYILCALNLDDYHEQMANNFLPLVRKLSGTDYYRFSAEVKMEQRYTKEGFTAHLHMDILPDFKGQGVDSQLLNAMMTKLKDDYVEGAFAVCGLKDNELKDFYAENGFEDYDYLTGCVVYTKKLYDED